jgi:hypothetical protein
MISSEPQVIQAAPKKVTQRNNIFRHRLDLINGSSGAPNQDMPLLFKTPLIK